MQPSPKTYGKNSDISFFSETHPHTSQNPPFPTESRKNMIFQCITPQTAIFSLKSMGYPPHQLKSDVNTGKMDLSRKFSLRISSQNPPQEIKPQKNNIYDTKNQPPHDVVAKPLHCKTLFSDQTPLRLIPDSQRTFFSTIR
jgi:hypothetical protein